MKIKIPQQAYKFRTVGLARRIGFYTGDMKLETVYADGQEVKDMKKEKANFATPIPVLLNRVPISSDRESREIIR